MMRNHAIKKSILIFIIGLLVLPNISFAQLNLEELIENQDNIELKKEDTEKILNTLINKLTREFIEITTSSNFKIEEQGVLVILLQELKIHALEYLLLDLGGGAIKTTLELAYLLVAQDPLLVIEELEDFTVDRAKEYAMDWLLQKEIKVGKGNLKFSYPAYAGSWEQGVLPYIVAYKPLDSESGEVAIGIYSSEIVKTPNPSMRYQWEGGIYELPPFIVEIRGEIYKEDNLYIWTRGPEIEIIFDEPVPEFEFKEPTIADRFESALSKLGLIIGRIKEKGGGIMELIIDGAEFIWDKVTLLFSRSSDDSFTASIIDPLPYSDQEGVQGSGESDWQDLEQGLNRLWTDFEELVEPAELDDQDINERDIQEILDDIGEKIDVLVREINELIESQGLEESEELEIVLEQEIDLEIELTVELNDEEEEGEEEQEEEQRVVRITYSRGGGGGGSTPPPSYCSLTSIGEPELDSVIFNEVAWMGTNISSDDEWIELKNITNEQINLSAWQILDKNQQIKVILDDGNNISPNGLFLLERSDDNSVPSVLANNIYTGALNNSDERLYLFDDNCNLQDVVEANPDWPAGNNEEKRSMERNTELGWYTYFGIGDNGIMGTPMLENSVESIIEVVSESNGEIFEPDPRTEEPSQEVIFNEIAWMGTRASSNDEWIELYNTDLEPIEILDWQIIFYPIDGNERITTLSILETVTPAIDGLSYFLLERTNEEPISDIQADYIFTGALNDNGGILELRDSDNNLIDKVDVSDGWFAGDKDAKISMERVSLNDWADNNLIVHNGEDVEDNKVWGTPRAKNSIESPTEISKPLPFDEFEEITLRIESSPYIVKYYIDVPEEKTLNIDSGVVLKFDDSNRKMTISGTLKAIGEEDDKILFTSSRDEPYPGAWDKIEFTPTSINSELNNIILQYAGGGYGTPCSPEMA